MTRRGAASLILGQWMKYALQLIAFVALSRILPPSDFGLLAIAMAIGGFATVLGDFGLSLSALRAESLSAAEKSNLFWLNAAFGGLVAFAVFAASVPAGAIFDSSTIGQILAYLALAFLLNGLSVQFRVEINRRGAFATLATIDVVAQFTAVAAAIILAVMGLGVAALVAQTVMYSASVFLLSVYFAHWIPGRFDRSTPLRSHLKFGAYTSLAQILNYASVSVIPIVIGLIGGPSQAGFYNRASQLAVLPVQQVAAPLTRAVLPQLSRAETITSFKISFRAWQRSISYTLLAALSFLGVIATPLLTFAIGPEWAPAGAYVQILAVASAFQAVGYAFYWGSLAKGISRELFLSELPGRLTSILLAALLIPLGSVAVAASAACGAAIVWLTQSMMLPRHMGLESGRIFVDSTRVLLVFAAASAAGAGVSVTLAAQPTWAIVLLSVIAWAATIAISFIFRSVREDVRSIFVTLRRKR